MIEGIKEIGLKFQGLGFCKFEVLENGNIPIVDARPAQRVAAHIAMAEQWNVPRDREYRLDPD